MLKRLLPVGVRSVLYGAHCFLIHPVFVFVAWWKLYGFPSDPRLWVAFFVHDLGYAFQKCQTMDGEDGERHPEWGANLCHRLFDGTRREVCRYAYNSERERAILELTKLYQEGWSPVQNDGLLWTYEREGRDTTWRDLCLYHSRFYAKRDGMPPSRLCMADKLAGALEPWWLYLPRVILSGEIWEYMAIAGGREGSKYNGEPEVGEHKPLSVLEEDENLTKWQRIRAWHKRMSEYLAAYAWAHKDGEVDTWTPEAKADREAVREAK